MKSRPFLTLGTLTLLSMSLPVTAEEQKSTSPKMEWVWLNGSLVYVNPKHIEAKAPSGNVEVEWQLEGGKVVPVTVKEEPIVEIPTFDPYLEKAPRSTPEMTAKVRFKNPKSILPPEVPIGYRDGSLPDPAKEEQEEEPLPQGPQLRIEDLSAPQLQMYGVILGKESKALKKRFDEVTKSKSPAPEELKAYLKDAAEFQVRLDAYRDRAEELREEASQQKLDLLNLSP